MSESQSTTAQESGTHKPAGGSPIRLVVRVILFGILLYLICALPYDYFVARPGQLKAWEKLYNKRAEQGDPEYSKDEEPGLLQVKNIGSGDVETTTETVASALGRKPSKSTSERGTTTEVYSWRAGLPWKTYNIYVVYAERRDKTKKPRLENAFLNEMPTDLNVPSEEPSDMLPTDPGAPAMPSGGPPPIRRGPGTPGGQTPSRPDAENPEKTGDKEAAPTKDAESKSSDKGEEAKP